MVDALVSLPLDSAVGERGQCGAQAASEDVREQAGVAGAALACADDLRGLFADLAEERKVSAWGRVQPLCDGKRLAIREPREFAQQSLGLEEDFDLVIELRKNRGRKLDVQVFVPNYGSRDP